MFQKCPVVKLGVHNLVQHVCSIGNCRLVRPKQAPHVAPIYEPLPLKSLIVLTYQQINCHRMDNCRILLFQKVLIIILSWIPVFENVH